MRRNSPFSVPLIYCRATISGGLIRLGTVILSKRGREPDRYYSLRLRTLVGPYIETCKLTVIDSSLELPFITAFPAI